MLKRRHLPCYRCSNLAHYQKPAKCFFAWIYTLGQNAVFYLVADTSPNSSLYAGDSSTWTTTLQDYPASSSWVAVCVFQKNGSQPFKIEATASGANHVFTLTADQTAALKPGKWIWAIRVSKDTTTKTVSTGETVVRPNPEATLEESHAEKCVKLLQAAVEDRFVDVQESISVLGQDITKIPAGELHRLLNYYQARVNKEWRFHERLRTGKRQRRSRIYLVD